MITQALFYFSDLEPDVCRRQSAAYDIVLSAELERAIDELK